MEYAGPECVEVVREKVGWDDIGMEGIKDSIVFDTDGVFVRVNDVMTLDWDDGKDI